MSSVDPDEVKVQVRWMLRRDMHDVLAIERECFEYAWSEEEFLNCLRMRNCIGVVAELDRKIVGFMIYELPKNKIHLLNIATLREYRRLGVATQMIAKLIGKLAHPRRNRITLQVRETNLQAQLFFRSSGFRATEILKDFYEETCEDAYFMQYRRADSIPLENFCADTAQLSAVYR